MYRALFAITLILVPWEETWAGRVRRRAVADISEKPAWRPEDNLVAGQQQVRRPLIERKPLPTRYGVEEVGSVVDGREAREVRNGYEALGSREVNSGYGFEDVESATGYGYGHGHGYGGRYGMVGEGEGDEGPPPYEYGVERVAVTEKKM